MHLILAEQASTFSHPYLEMRRRLDTFVAEKMGRDAPPTETPMREGHDRMVANLEAIMIARGIIPNMVPLHDYNAQCLIIYYTTSGDILGGYQEVEYTGRSQGTLLFGPNQHSRFNMVIEVLTFDHFTPKLAMDVLTDTIDFYNDFMTPGTIFPPKATTRYEW